MNASTIGLIFTGIMLLLILLGFQVGVSLLVLGFVGLLIVAGVTPALSTMGFIPYSRISEYDFAVLPLFVLMGNFVAYTAIGKQSYDMARIWIGRIRGGLAMATVAACGLFAACTGSSSANALTMGKIAYPEMERFRYNRELALGCIAAGGTIGIMIPPSTAFVLIGILAELSIGKLFIAGIIPGVLQVIFYIIAIFIMCRFDTKLGPPAPATSLKEKVESLSLVWPVLLLVIIVLGGLYAGVFTPTEAGGIGAFGALLIGLGQKHVQFSTLNHILLDTAKVSAMIALMIIGSFVLSNFLAVTRVPYIASEFVVSLNLNRYVILIGVVIFYLIMGMLFDIYAIVVLTIPILYPAMQALDFNLIWFGVLTCRLMEIGMISPPFGLNLFFLSGGINVPLGQVYRGVIPFLIADCFHLALLIAVPQLSLLLPDMMM